MERHNHPIIIAPGRPSFFFAFFAPPGRLSLPNSLIADFLLYPVTSVDSSSRRPFFVQLDPL